MKKIVLLALIQFVWILSGFSQNEKVATEASGIGREHLLLDSDWLFAFGHPFDAAKDFNNGTGYFSYYTKAGYGDGAASKDFDDRAWRKLDLPHDWCVELSYDEQGGHSHGYKAIGRNFPENSVGWYRKKLFIPKSDQGTRIT
jgi:beta-galactosidase